MRYCVLFIAGFGQACADADSPITDSGPQVTWEGTTHEAPEEALSYVEVVDVDGYAVDVVDVFISDEDFKALADQFDLWDVPLGEDGYPLAESMPPLSSACSIASTVTGSSATQTSSASKSASCYNYVMFSGDTESDCYIKFSSYAKKSKYYYDDINTCARTADLYYGHALAAYYDSSSNVYLRLDSKWCKYSSCEDGFKITY
jgi:hypothetical protein